MSHWVLYNCTEMGSRKKGYSMRNKYNIIKVHRFMVSEWFIPMVTARLSPDQVAPTHGPDSEENLMTASRSILIDLGAILLSRRSLKRLLLRPCASLISICASKGRVSSGSSYLRQKSSIESLPRNPGISRGGRRRLDFSYSKSASWSSSSDIF